MFPLLDLAYSLESLLFDELTGIVYWGQAWLGLGLGLFKKLVLGPWLGLWKLASLGPARPRFWMAVLLT